MGYNNVYRSIRGTIKRDTGKAILFVVRDPEAITEEDEIIEAWIPTSQIKSIHTLKDDFGEKVIMASEWILKQKDLLRLSSNDNPLKTVTSVSSHPKAPTTPPVKPRMEVDDDCPF